MLSIYLRGVSFKRKGKKLTRVIGPHYGIELASFAVASRFSPPSLLTRRGKTKKGLNASLRARFGIRTRGCESSNLCST